MPSQLNLPQRLWSASAALRGYFWVSCCALGVDSGLLYALANGLHVPNLVAASISFCAGCCVAYFLSSRWVFTTSRSPNAADLTLFSLLGLVGLIVNAAVIGVATEFFRLPLLQAKLCAAAGTFFTNYLLRKRWVFSDSSTSAGAAIEEGLD